MYIIYNILYYYTVLENYYFVHSSIHKNVRSYVSYKCSPINIKLTLCHLKVVYFKSCQ